MNRFNYDLYLPNGCICKIVTFTQSINIYSAIYDSIIVEIDLNLI